VQEKLDADRRLIHPAMVTNVTESAVEADRANWVVGVLAVVAVGP
jgi:hypothetical protein